MGARVVGEPLRPPMLGHRMLAAHGSSHGFVYHACRTCALRAPWRGVNVWWSTGGGLAAIPADGRGGGLSVRPVVVRWCRCPAARPGGGGSGPPGIERGLVVRYARPLWGPLAVALVPLSANRRCKGSGLAVSGGRGISHAVACVPIGLSRPARGNRTGRPAAARVIVGGVCPPLRLSPGATSWDGGYWSSARSGVANPTPPVFWGQPCAAAAWAGVRAARGLGGMRVRGVCPCFWRGIGHRREVVLRVCAAVAPAHAAPTVSSTRARGGGICGPLSAWRHPCASSACRPAQQAMVRGSALPHPASPGV